MHYMRVRISSQLLIGICIQGHESHVKCIKGLPEGTEFKYVTTNQLAGLDLVVEHFSFKELNDGDEIPIFDPIMFDSVK